VAFLATEVVAALATGRAATRCAAAWRNAAAPVPDRAAPALAFIPDTSVPSPSVATLHRGIRCAVGRPASSARSAPRSDGSAPGNGAARVPRSYRRLLEPI
jgi:hypothetical protein